jgi:hypothetical protein
MLIAYLIFSALVYGWLAYAWSSRTTSDVFFKLFLIGMTAWGAISLITKLHLQ